MLHVALSFAICVLIVTVSARCQNLKVGIILEDHTPCIVTSHDTPEWQPCTVP